MRQRTRGGRPRSGLTFVAVVAMVLTACDAPARKAELEHDNPIRPLAAAPFGLEDFFAAEPRTPDPRRARLGRWLFYDTRLSADGRVSCATCHRPEHAFSEPTAVSTGVGGRRGHRKAMAIANLGARTLLVDTPEPERSHAFFWDGRADGLEAQVLQPIANPVEMGLNAGDLVAHLAGVRGYAPYFSESFGSREVTTSRVASALADYVRTLRSGNSAYDRWRYGGDAGGMSLAAQRGSDVFFFTGRCAVCHAGFNFSDGRYFNLGVGWNARTARFSDEGRAAVTGRSADRGRFKTPPLRDVSKHAPYMHDGSLPSLRAVVEFYNRGGNGNPWRSGRIRPLNLTEQDIDDLVAFLQALDSDKPADVAPSLFPR
jgi:cytochrome c peroxidase